MSKRILVVDDDSDICFVLKSVLCDNGFVVDSYDDHLIALENFKADFYNFYSCNLDIKMPELDGLSLYGKIKRLDKEIKVCFLTAGEMYYRVDSDIFSSVPENCLIRKPIENEELMEG
jgi:CheY-like chemotaxis protein